MIGKGEGEGIIALKLERDLKANCKDCKESYFEAKVFEHD